MISKNCNGKCCDGKCSDCKCCDCKCRENEKTVKSLINSITWAMLLIDLNGNVIQANTAAAGMMGTTVEELKGQSIVEAIPSKLLQQIRENIYNVVNNGAASSFEDKRDGKHLKHSFFPVFDSERTVTRVAVLSQDITESKRIEKALRDSEVRFRSIFENTASGIALVSLEGYYFLANEALSNIVGYSMEELSNMSIADITHPEDHKRELEMIRRLVSGEIKNYSFEKRYIHKNGSVIWVLLTRSLVRDSNGDPFYTIGQIQNISLQKQVEEQLKQAKLEAENAREQAEEARASAELRARTDYLTGLLNRRAFMDRLTEEANRIIRRKASVAIILTDIDFFKRINDTYGHKTGDKVLQAFSHCLDSICRPYDFIGRYGGEEFVICLPEVDLECGREIAERMRSAVQDLRVNVPGKDMDINITASFGIVASRIETGGQIEKMIGRADELMYKAKQTGRNRVVAESFQV